MKPHVFAQMVNEVRDLSHQYGQMEQFRCRVADLLGKYIPVSHGPAIPYIEERIRDSLQHLPESHVHQLAQECVRRGDEMEAARKRIAELEAGRGVVPDDACPRVEQTVLHVPGKSRGNCFSATVAGLLKLPIEAIPQFAATDDKSWQEQFNEWLRQFGLAWFPMEGDDLASECQQLGIKGLWSEMSGKSPRFEVGHSCVAKDGRFAWDPHPSQSGLDHPIWWHGVFIALRPWECASRAIPSDRVLREGQVPVDREALGRLEEKAAFVRRYPNTPPEYFRLEAIFKGGAPEVLELIDALRAQAGKDPCV